MNIEEPLISIIVPVYNTEKYLEECVQSCVKQSYSNFEIILVDDGSTDGSGQLCEKLAKSDERVLIFHKINGGLSDTRNYGLDKSKGDYIVFVDSDDIISEMMLSTLYKEMNENKADIVSCDLAHFVDGDRPFFVQEYQKTTLLSDDALKELLYQKTISTSSCGKIYKRSSLIENRFVKGQRFEDNDFLFRMVKNSTFIVSTNAKLYGYRHRKKSITSSSFSKNDFDIIDIGKKIINETEKMSEDVKKAAIAYQCSNAMRIYLTISAEYYNEKNYNYCLKFLSDNARNVIKDSNARKKIKIALFIYFIRVPRCVLVYLRNHINRWK